MAIDTRKPFFYMEYFQFRIKEHKSEYYQKEISNKLRK